MTEEQWLAATNPTLMLEFIRGKVRDRKLLLFCLAWCPTYYREGAECERYSTAYRFAEGNCALNELRMAWIRDEDPAYPSNFAIPEKPFLWARSLTRSEHQFAGTPPVDQAPTLIREILGNPFRPFTFSPDWRTDTVLTLATQMYESRDFGAMPILADALQDAGCESAAVLDHCRGDGSHVRGCWAVDLVLGKE